VKRAAPEYRGRGQVQFRGQNTNTEIMGTTPEHREIRNFRLTAGRFLTHSDVSQRAKVAVLGAEVQEELFGRERPVGKRLKLNGQSYRVVGVLEAKGGSGWRNPDDQVYIPVTTAMRRVFGVDHTTGLSVQAVSQERMDAAYLELESLLRRRHRLPANAPNDFRINNQADLIETAEQTNATITLLLAVIGGISLFVGGIGIMNIMLVSVTERTREIGIRKAIGAKRKDILTQFLMEAIAISLVGGLIGAGIGLAIPSIVSLWTGWPTRVSAGPVLLSFSFAAAVGVFFGLYPALTAARLNPIEALRYE
jgi:ABC-type antimicrobial peptide transport system permease subunit